MSKNTSENGDVGREESKEAQRGRYCRINSVFSQVSNPHGIRKIILVYDRPQSAIRQVRDKNCGTLLLEIRWTRSPTTEIFSKSSKIRGKPIFCISQGKFKRESIFNTKELEEWSILIIFLPKDIWLHPHNVWQVLVTTFKRRQL